MKPKFILIMFTLMFATAACTSNGNKNRSIQPSPAPSTPPRSGDDTGITSAGLPALPQAQVFANLNLAFRNDSIDKRLAMQKAFVPEFEAARENFEKISALEKKTLPKVLLWTLNADAEMIQYYAIGGDEKYATAAFNHLNSVARAPDPENEANVTVITVNHQGQRQDGFQICYLPAEWEGLSVSPLVFPNPSGSSETLPKTNWMFWSKDFVNSSKVGAKTSKNIDKNQSLSIGIPP